MKHLTAKLVAVLILAALTANAAQILIGGLVAVNNTTTNSAAVSVGTITTPAQTIYVQNGGLTATNALIGRAQISLDNTNWITIQTYVPAATNATTETVFVAPSTQTLYFRVAATTTNSVNLGAVIQ